MKRAWKILGGVVGLVVVAAVGGRLYLTPVSAAPGGPPKGYGSNDELKAAYVLGALKLVDMNPPLPEGVTERMDVEYGKAGDRSLQLDLYSPQHRVAPVPGLIFIHGGAWKGGRRGDYRVYTTHFASRGYVVATISYRLSGVAPFPAAVEDAKCAVRWMRSHAAELGVNPDKIAVVGGSAGGHLALMLGYSAGDPSLEGQGGHAGVSSAVQAVVNFYGPSDLTTPFAQKADVVKKFMGGKSFDEARALWEQASPLHHLQKGAPPTLTFHGTIDDIVPVEQSDVLHARLKDLGVPNEYERLTGWPHTMDAAVAVNQYARAHIEEFLAKHLGPVPGVTASAAK
jgi:acetyl esterase/lipase